MNVAIRVSVPFADLDKFCDLIRSQCTSCIIYEHQSSRVHIHGLIKGCKVSTDTLKNYVKRSLAVTSFPKTDWSFKTQFEGGDIDDRFITYMSKGILDPVFLHNCDDESIAILKSKWVPVVKQRKAEMVQYKLKIENPRESKIRQNEMMDMVKQRCSELGYKRGRPVLEIIRQVVYVENRTIVGRYKLRDFYDYVVSDTDHEKFLDNMEKIILFKEI